MSNNSIRLGKQKLNSLFKEANLMFDNGQFVKAKDLYLILLRHSISHFQIELNLGIIYYHGNNITKSIVHFKKSVSIDNKSPIAFNNLGLALLASGDYKEARKSFIRAIKLDPAYIDPINNIAISYHELNQYPNSLKYYNMALNINPTHPKTLNNLGNLFKELGDIKKSIRYYYKALETSPGYIIAHRNLSESLLLQGDYINGFKYYQSRLQLRKSNSIVHASPSLPLLSKDLINTDHDVLVVSEQGLGDTIQFMRYIPYLLSRKTNILFSAQTKLHSLIKASGIHPNPISSKEAENIKLGSWLPLLSLPYLLNVTPQNPLVTSPYVKVPKSLVNKWSNIISEETRPLIGVNWQGSPESKRRNLIGRSILLQELKPFIESCTLTLLSLQKGYGSDQITECSFADRFVSCQEVISSEWDFLENAAIIQCCDIVITTDTAVAHLSGALGKETWLLLNYVPDWRWGLENSNTFWYPSIKIFRKKRLGGWSSVIREISLAIKSRYG